MHEERLLKVLYKPHVSEKTSNTKAKINTIVFKVAKNSVKSEIRSAVQKLYKVEVKAVNTLEVKGKTKHHGKRVGRRSNWKKAYITLKKGQNLELIGDTE